MTFAASSITDFTASITSWATTESIIAPLLNMVSSKISSARAMLSFGDVVLIDVGDALPQPTPNALLSCASRPLTLTDKDFRSIFKCLMKMCDDGLPSLDMPLSKKARKRKSQKKNKASKIGSKHSLFKLASSLVLDKISIGHPTFVEGTYSSVGSSIITSEAVGILSLVGEDAAGVCKEGTPSGCSDAGFANGLCLATAFLLPDIHSFNTALWCCIKRFHAAVNNCCLYIFGA
ncbi:hypothetical protein HDV02_000838 [Globomyces sp. JEL0801]|nr:hypothetical protein HDV02_000838 [Globomyces sp. JEL0801]